jgi:hypothetical protein
MNAKKRNDKLVDSPQNITAPTATENQRLQELKEGNGYAVTPQNGVELLTLTAIPYQLFNDQT